MLNRFCKILMLPVVCLLITGCATTQAQRPPEADAQNEVIELQKALQEKEQQIQDLQSQIESQTQALAGAGNIQSRDKTAVIRVAGVRVQDVQAALVKVGLDPGPVDGRMGKKTKAAIKEFQRSKGLNPDGIVGERTWSLLK